MSEYFTPVYRAPLTDLKCAYIEAINPLLGRQVVDVVAQLPEELRYCHVAFERR